MSSCRSPIVGRSSEQLRAYIEGEDPVLKEPFVKGVIEGLTRPLSDKDLEGAEDIKIVVTGGETQGGFKFLQRPLPWTRSRRGKPR